MTIFGEILDKEIELVLAMNEKLSVKNQGHLKGTAFEHSFRNILSKFVPNNIDISRGWILYPDGTQSEERDFLVYNKTKAPAFLFDSNTGIIPLLSILYDIQIKSTLSPKMINEAYKKSDSQVPYLALIGNKGKNILKEYSKIDPQFYTNPKIKILSSEDDGYYSFQVEKRKFEEIISINDILENIKSQLNIHLNLDKKEALEKLTLNTHKLSDLLQYQITICRWIKYNQQNETALKSFIIGFANTLFHENIGQYIVNNSSTGIVKSLVITDHNGKIIHIEKITDNIPTLNAVIHPSITIKENGEIEVSIVENNSAVKK